MSCTGVGIRGCTAGQQNTFLLVVSGSLSVCVLFAPLRGWGQTRAGEMFVVMLRHLWRHSIVASTGGG